MLEECGEGQALLVIVITVLYVSQSFEKGVDLKEEPWNWVDFFDNDSIKSTFCFYSGF